MKFLSSLILILFIVSMNDLYGQSGKPALQNDMPLKYLVRQPLIKTGNPPVIILLHGVGSNEEDLFGLANELPKEAVIISARAPIKLSENGYGWYHINYANGAPSADPAEAETSKQLIAKFTEQVVKKYHAPHSKVFLLGFSQGAIMSYSMALTQAEHIAGIVVLSGRMLDQAKSKADIIKAKQVAVFIAHGEDDKVLNIQYARDAHNWFNQQKLPASYHEYKKMGHEISQNELMDINSWLSVNLKKLR